MLEDKPMRKPETRKRRNEFGFTLIEIMIVIAIIGILASIATPMFAKHKENASNSAAHSDVHHVFLFENQFFNEHAEFAPVTIADKQATGAVSINVALLDGSAQRFEINLSKKVDVLCKVSASKQSVICGGRHHGGSKIIAIDLDAPGTPCFKKSYNPLADADITDPTDSIMDLTGANGWNCG